MLDEASSYPAARAAILLAIGFLEMLDGELESGRARMLESKKLVDEIGTIGPLGPVSWPPSAGYAEYLVGDPALATTILAGWVEVLRGTGAAGFLASSASLYAQALVEIGDLARVEVLVAEGRAIGLIEDIDAQVRWRLALAALRLRERRLSEAVTLLEEAAALVRDTEFTLLAIEVELAMNSAAQESGDLGRAAAAQQRGLDLATQKDSRALISRITGA